MTAAPTIPGNAGEFDQVLREMLGRERLYAEDFYALVEIMPKALSVAAKAMEVTIPEFRARMEKGLLNPHVVLSRMARLLSPGWTG